MMFLYGQECRSLYNDMVSPVKNHSQRCELTLADANTEQIQQSVQETFQSLEVEGVQIDQVAQSLNHSGREPDAHIFLCAESR